MDLNQDLLLTGMPDWADTFRSASSLQAEAVLTQVFAGAIQDNKRGTIAGETTFGKGLIQTIVELSDGSAVSVTVARYQTPAGTDINKVGIKPDLVLDDQTLLPTDGQNFCQVLASSSAPKLFK